MSNHHASDGSLTPPVVQQFVCKRCGAVCDPGRKQCWMCKSDSSHLQSIQLSNPYAVSVQRPMEAKPQSSKPKPHDGRFDTLFFILLISSLVLAILVGFGMALEDPGALIAYLVLIGPAFLVTSIRGLWQLGSEEGLRPGGLLVNMFVSFAVTIAVLAVLGVAAIILLFTLCLWHIANP